LSLSVNKMTVADTPVFSVIVPAYNASGTIRYCLESVCSQHFSSFEIWIIDGGSPDNTIAVVKEFQNKDSRVKYISEKDNGIYDAINKGIDKATGEWLIFLGADDQLYNADVLTKIAEKVQPETGMIYGNVKVVGELLWAKNGDIYDGAFTVGKLFHKNICHQSVFYRKSIFSEIGNYNTDYKTSADWDLNHRCFAYCKVQYVDEIISCFYAGGFSTNSTNDKFSNMDIVLNLRKYHKIGYFNKTYKPYYWVFFNLSVNYLTSRQYLKSLYFLFFSVLYAEKKTGLVKNYLSVFLHRNKPNRSGI